MTLRRHLGAIIVRVALAAVRCIRVTNQLGLPAPQDCEKRCCRREIFPKTIIMLDISKLVSSSENLYDRNIYMSLLCPSLCVSIILSSVLDCV